MEQHTSPILVKKRTLNVGGKLFSFEKPLVMGIVNVTPDSFLASSRFVTEKRIIERVTAILQEGGTFVDVGAISTRPGADTVSESEEQERLAIALNAIRHIFPEVIISVDTYRASIAKWAVNEFDVNMINDISAGSMDANMFDIIAGLNVPYVVMHMQGTPQTMQNDPMYNNAPKEIMTELSGIVNELKQRGVCDIIIDPGFGFGKNIDHNYQMLNTLELYKFFEEPLLVGVSRKSMIYRLLQSTPEEALNGTTVINTIALLKGANILRVHDVKAAVEAVQIVSKMQSVA
jgi:dihydropteroate synthase